MTMTETPSLFPDAVERVTPPGKGEHGYYKRRTDGWIITAGVWPSYKADMNFKGLDFLPSYGTFTYGTPWGETNKDRRGIGFNAISAPWRLILQSPGGIDEFPVAQIIAYRWHIRPPYREIRFPQLEGLEVVDLFCPECNKGIFSSVAQQEAVDMLRIHLTSQVNGVHSYRPEDLRALGKEIDIDFFAPRKGRYNVRDRAAPKDSAPDAIDLTPNDEVGGKLCPECGETISVLNFAFARHVKAHKKASAAPA